MPPTKYDLFIVSDSYERTLKLGCTNETRLYVSITCPHCNVQFTEVPNDSIDKMKSTKCLQHLRVCTAYQGDVKPAPQIKKTEMDMLRERAEQAEARADARHKEAMAKAQQQHDEMMREMREEAERRHRETLQAIWESQSTDPPPIVDQHDLERRLSKKRKEDRSIRDALKRICKDERQARMMRRALHPDGSNANFDDLDLVRNALGL